MGVASDILASYRAPRRVMRRHLAAGPREDRSLFFLMLGCALIFVGQWPRLMRLAAEQGEVPFQALLGGALLGWLFLAPLFLYALAALSHLLARGLGGRGSFAGARLALFWALLAATPLWLLNGLVAGMAGGGPVLAVSGAVALAGFLAIWFLSLVEAESPGAAAAGETPS